MNDEIDEAIKKVTKTIEQWDEETNAQNPTVKTAKELQFQLSVMKLLVGIDKFDELPAFARYLREVTAFLNEVAKLEAKSKI